MTETRHYDAAIVGSGQGGKPLAAAMAAAGYRTALIERKHVGGSCVNDGCTPTKTLVASARVAHLARRAADYGVATGPVGVDLAQVRRRKRDIVNRFRGGSEKLIRKTKGLDLVMGEASFTSPKELQVRLNEGGTLALTADRIFLNTGTRPYVPPIEGLDEVPFLDNASIMELDAPPEHLLILGGGYIGLEFGQMFRRFGSEVTIVQRNEHLLPREDADVSDEVAKILRQDGIEVLLNAETRRAGRIGEEIELLARTPERGRTLSGSHLLVAAGRVPNTEALNLEAADVQTDERGFVMTNERLETSAEGVWALGDAKGGEAFTHVSYDDFRVIRTNLLEGGDATTSGRLIPYAVFIDPQLGRVGLTEQEARERSFDIRVAKMPMKRAARAIEVDETQGFMKAVVDVETGRILGAAILGIEGGEIVSVLQVAMMGGLPYTAIRDGVFAHPTLVEALNNLFSERFFSDEGARNLARPA